MQSGLSQLIYVLAFVAVVLIVQTGTGLLMSTRDRQKVQSHLGYVGERSQ